MTMESNKVTVDMNPQEAELQDRTIVRIAAHLPDLVVYGVFSAERPSVDYFDGVLMFVDISGFTAMTEKFSTSMYIDRGAEQLVEILNHYISAIVEKVLIFGGDILKFAGDALLALWKVERKQLKNIIMVVIKCSMEIQEIFRDQEAEGLEVRVKIGLAAGHISMLVFGDKISNFFLVVGPTVNDVRLAQNMAQMNDVILSPNCWQLCDRNMVEIERIPDQRAVKVNFLKLPPTFNFDAFFTKCMTFMDYYPGHYKNLLRLACMLETDPNLEQSLQKYVMESIVKQIEAKQLQGYLSELRPVTIVFVNLTFKDQDKAEVIGSAIQESALHISAVLRIFRGQINKVFMFDKGCSFLCVFGFPGEKAPDESTHALESAMDIFDFCSQVPKIHTVSIGVASGTVFCGIIGHAVRHEYTVIGRKVNIAARMMTYYPGMVTCDAVTYDCSNLPACFFKELPKKTMKGVSDAGPVYRCLDLKEKVTFGTGYLTCSRSEGYPLLGRDKELDYFRTSMKEFLMLNCSRIVMYEGLSGYGKSQILMEIKYLSQGENHKTVAIALNKISFHHSFYTIQTLMANVLGLDSCKHYKERQTNIQSQVGALLDEKFYCIFNDIFYVQFPLSREVSKMSSLKKQKQLEALFMKILEKKAIRERVIFIIDEGHFVDWASWTFLEKLIRNVPIFIVMSLSPFPEKPCTAANTIIRNRNTCYITLGPVQPSNIRNKVCVDLNVKGIPKELDLYLMEGSCGIPFYCEELLKNLYQHRVLSFHSVEAEGKANLTWNNLFNNVSKPTEAVRTLSFCHDDESEEVCKLASGVRLRDLSPPESLKELSLVQLDSMSLPHQMLVRYAAIIGLTFTTELLFEILPCWNMKMMITALAILMESKIFDCFRSGLELRAALRQNPASFEVNFRSQSLQLNKGIANPEARELRELESKVIECHIIRFCTPMVQKTAYELWLKDQKVAMHLKCARFLEENAHRCNRCHSGDFIPYHHFTVDIRLNSLDMDSVRKKAMSKGLKIEKEITFPRIEIPGLSETISEDFSPENIRHKILTFLDTIIRKMSPSQEDIAPLESCQCEEILEIVIVPLAYHFLALGENHKALYYFLETAAAFLIIEDNYMAYTYLKEGERLLKTLKNKKASSHIFESATLYSLKGQVCFNMGQMVLAKKTLKKALKLLNRVFPYNLVSLFSHIHEEKKRYLSYMKQQAQESMPPGKKQLAELYQQTTCFSLLWKVYSLNYIFHYKYYAQLAALMGLNAALETQDDFQIIKAYLEYSMYQQVAGCQGVWCKYEVMVIEHIMDLPLKDKSIEIMAHVAHTLGYNKLIMGYLDLAIDLGSRAQKMWALLQNPYKQYAVLCWLSRCLFWKNRYAHLVQVLGWLWDLAVAEEHILSKAFFYFICLDLILYSGFVYKTFKECMEFIDQNENNRTLKFQSGVLLGLYSCMAVWYARLQKWDEFEIFFNKAKNLGLKRTPTVLYFQGVCRFMEAQVLHLQKQIQEHSESAQDSGMELLKSLEGLVSQNPISTAFTPRLYHLMAYVCILLGDGHGCDLFLNTAFELSETHGNLLEACWLSMSNEWWFANTGLTENPWLQTILNLPTWEKIESGKVDVQEISKNKFLMRVNVLDNPF